VVWLGNQWLTSQAPHRERNYDLLRFETLEISEVDGLIEPIRWQQNISLSYVKTNECVVQTDEYRTGQ
jgi:hypothetical protein